MKMADTSPTGVVDPKSYTILIVDDEPANLGTVTECLAGHGFQVKVGQTGEIGLELARQAQPDLILLDVQLPGIDGLEVCRRLKADEQTQDIPIIFMTVLTGVEDKVKGFEAGGVDYITKPFQEQEVLARVTTHLRLRDLMQVLEEAKESLERRVEKRTTALTQANQGLQAEIAERRRAEAGLKRERALIANIMDTSPVSITVVNHEGQVTFANSQAMQVLGLTTDKITQRTYNAPAWRITDFAGDPFPDEKLPFRQVMTTRQSIYDVQHAIEWPNGRRVLLSINGTPILDESGQVESVVFALQDITERKQAELERQSHVQFLESMDQINRAMQGTDDLDQMMSDVLDIVLSVFDCDRAFLTHPLDPDASSWFSVMERTRPEYPGILALEMNEVPMDEEVAQTSRLLLNIDAPLKFGTGNPHPLPTDVSKRLNIKSLMAMALYPKVGKPWQFGIHQCSHARIWTSDEERLFQEIGRRLNDGLTSMLTYRDLYESEFKLAEAERIAHIGYWDRDFNTGQVRISEEARRIFGVNGELTDWFETWIDVVHPDDKERMAEVSKSLSDLLQHSDQYEIEYRLVWPDGDVRHVHSHVEVMRDESGRPQRIFGTIEDITERKKAEMEIYASEQLFRALVENSPDFIARYDREYRRIYVNPAIQSLFKDSTEGVLDKSPADQSPIYAPQVYIEHLQRAIETATENIGEMPFRTAQGEMHWGQIRFVPEFDSDGQVATVLAIGRDIHEIKENERRFRMLAENFPDLIARFDRDGRHTYVNPAIENAFGMSAEALVGKTLQELAEYYGQVDELLILIQRAYDEGVPNEFETHWNTEIGERIFDVRHAPEKDAAGNVVSVLGIARDITEQKQARQEIQKLNQVLEQRVAERTVQLETAIKEMEAFTYSVSHDLRAPLRHIDGFIELLQSSTKTTRDDKSQHYMTVISDSAKKMGTLIDDLLAFSRMSRDEMSTLPVNLDELVQEVIREMEPETRDRDIHWEISPLPKITGDRAMLRVVLVNLISNALKFSSSRKQAQIEIGYMLDARKEVVFFVRDNGVGFDMQYADKLFGVFQRLHREDEFEGTGIGLANVRRIISRHGGRVWAEGKVDQGATFYFSLPQSILKNDLNL